LALVTLTRFSLKLTEIRRAIAPALVLCIRIQNTRNQKKEFIPREATHRNPMATAKIF
jgi:hypothetical protein